MQGIVLEIDLKSDSGLIRGDDGARYDFKTQSCRGGMPLEGTRVDFEIKENAAAEIYVLSTPLRAKLDWLFWFLFSFRGRISRDQLIIFLAGAMLLLPFPAVCAAWSGYPSFFAIGGYVVTYACFAVLIKRFHDSGSSAFWLVFTIALGFVITALQLRIWTPAFIGTTAIYILIAFLALAVIFCLYLCFAKGSIGKNRYGEEPYFCRTVRLK